MKKQVAIFASGTGSNFEKIADDNRLKEKNGYCTSSL